MVSLWWVVFPSFLGLCSLLGVCCLLPWLLCVLVLSGCATSEQPSEETGVTWEEAKADAQAMELEIAAMIPADQVVSVVQKPTGVLLSCDQTQHNWNGSSSVTLTPGCCMCVLRWIC